MYVDCDVNINSVTACSMDCSQDCFFSSQVHSWRTVYQEATVSIKSRTGPVGVD